MAKKAKKAKSKAASRKVVRLRSKKPAKKAASNGLPPPSRKPFGQAGKALDGVKILDFTHVQSGPTCTQLLAYMGADCIKVERPGVGDITRGQLRDVKGQDSLYFTMLNGNKRSITIDSKNPKGKEIIERLVLLYPRLPVIVLAPSDAPARSASLTGASSVIGKPMDFCILRSAIERALSIPAETFIVRCIQRGAPPARHVFNANGTTAPD